MESEIIEHYRRAGKIGAQALEYGRNLIRPGVPLLSVATSVEEQILKQGAELAFPANIAINDQAAHFTPKHDDDALVFHSGDVVKLDIGAHIEGYICDTAITVEVGTRNWGSLIQASEDALRVAIESMRPNVPVNTIGARIEQTIATYGLNPISNLTGHSLEQYRLHAGGNIPNVDDDNQTRLKAGDVFAVEPFATNGAGRVDGTRPSNIYIYRQDRPIHNERAADLFEHIKLERKGLPFSERFCARYIDNPVKQIQYLVRIGAITSYPILCDIEHGIVSQREHTILITEDGCEVLSRA